MRVVFKHEDVVEEPRHPDDGQPLGPVFVDGVPSERWLLFREAQQVASLLGCQLEEE